MQGLKQIAWWLMIAGAAPVVLADDTASNLEAALRQLGDTPLSPPLDQDQAITSVGKKRQRLSDSAAAVSTVTQEQIRRSGVTNVADALRLVPGMQVARIDSNKWAVTARGFNGALANKLLVLMDGREVYNPAFAGVNWDVQDIPLEDIDRIEVIRGPGATLWGANAVNGVVNIITKHTRETQGSSLSVGGGSYEQGYGSLRYGMKLGEQTYGRVYAKGFNRDAFPARNGTNAQDQWSQERAGFRVDHDDSASNRLSLIGNAYRSELGQILSLPRILPPYNQTVVDDVKASGFNLLGRWSKALSLSSEFTVQGYYDHTYRQEGFGIQERDILDLDFQHRWRWNENHDITWGMGYRLIKEQSIDVGTGRFEPASANNQLFGAFAQDDVSLLDNRLVLTLGTKLQHNDYSGLEWMPSARLAWTPDQMNTLWGAISRAVRTPNRIICCAQIAFHTEPPFSPTNASPFPVVLRSETAKDLASEGLLAYEFGYRFRPKSNLTFDIALFYNLYNSLYVYDQAAVQITPVGIPLKYIDAAFPPTGSSKARSYGGELQIEWRPLQWWRLQLLYNYIDVQVGGLETSTATFAPAPEHQASVFSRADITDKVDLDLWLRYVDGFPVSFNGPNGDRVPSYVTMDARLAWRPVNRIELSVTAQNLLNGRHLEFFPEVLKDQSIEVPRSYYLQMNWQF